MYDGFTCCKCLDIQESPDMLYRYVCNLFVRCVRDRLPKSVKRRLKALKRLQSEANKVESRFYEEVHEIERKYMAQYEPFFQRVMLLCQIVQYCF